MTRLRQGGFSLLESVVALAVVTVAMLLVLALFVAEHRFRQVRDVRSRTLAAQESVLELLRSGYLALEPARFGEEELELLLDRPLPPMALWIEVEPMAVSGLYEVAVSTSYLAAGRLRVDRIPTRIRGTPEER